MRENRGVYYTPPPIVNFIVRAADDILKESFEIHDGLADNQRVTVLDFACGTGTFLLEVFQRIFHNIGGPEVGRADPIVREHFLRSVFGFEYLIAPYTIAHLKLSQYLKDQKHALRGNERLQVFLTNTLEPVEPQANYLLPAISAEVEAAQKVKDREILVILGNPPYSGHSKNKGAWITAAIEAYKRVDSKPLGEKNPKWLQDDYVKFLRFAQLKMDAVPEGIVGVITNHRWLDNPTFRGMRQSLMHSFNQIYVLDLHGYIKEQAPDGSDDENVFDIKQGVAISIFVKRPGLDRGIWRGDIWGKRIDKYRVTANATLKCLDWISLDPVTPFYLFAPQDAALRDEYKEGWKVTDIFPVNVLGFQTHRDAFAVSFTDAEMKRKLREFADARISDDELAQRYGLKSNRDWSLPKARSAAREGAATPPRLVAYRPFDDRWSEFSGLTMDYPRRELLDHVAGRDNLCLLTPRQTDTAAWRHAFAATAPAESCLVSSETKSQNYVFPIRTYKAGGQNQENLSSKFRTFLDEHYEHHYRPEEIFGYIYAVLSAPIYRKRYAEFLRIDFPRIPLPETKDAFDSLSALGWALVQAHLLRQFPRKKLATYHGKGDHTVDAVRYVPADEAIAINKDQFFRPVPLPVWEFHLGGYQVLDKYLKSRKGRKLSLDEINHVSAIADSLAFTIDQMAKIDAAYRAAFPDQG